MFKLRHRMLAGYVLPVLLTFVVAGLTSAGLTSIQESSNEVSNEYEITVLNSDLLEAALFTETGFRSYAITGDSAFLVPFEAGRRAFAETMALLEMRIKEADQLRHLAAVSQLIADLQRWQDDVIARRRGGGSVAEAAAAIATGAEQRYVDEIRQRFDEIKSSRAERMRDAVALRNESIRRVWFEVVFGALLGAALSLVAAYVIAARITTPVLGAVNTVSAVSTDIAARVAENEQSTVQLASAVSQTTAAMEELAASSRQSADQAEQLAAGARRVLTLADHGGATVDEMLRGTQTLKGTVKAVAEQILRLSEQTTQIGSITNVVGDLATQTNMLAINAAVEAARAGDHGKGFSVVAVEIRKLADESRKAAERITTLVSDIRKAINTTVMATEEGTKGVDLAAGLASRNADTFNSVTESITTTFEGTQQISLNAKQQSLAINEVVHAMNDLQGQREVTSARLAAARADIDRLRHVADDLRIMV